MKAGQTYAYDMISMIIWLEVAYTYCAKSAPPPAGIITWLHLTQHHDFTNWQLVTCYRSAFLYPASFSCHTSYFNCLDTNYPPPIIPANERNSHFKASDWSLALKPKFLMVHRNPFASLFYPNSLSVLSHSGICWYLVCPKYNPLRQKLMKNCSGL